MRVENSAKSMLEYLTAVISHAKIKYLVGLPFASLEVDNAVGPLEAVPCAIDTTNTGGGISLGIFCISLTDRIE